MHLGSSIFPGLGRSPGGGHGNRLDRRAWWAIESQRVRHDLSDLACMYIKVDQDMWSYLCKLKIYSYIYKFLFPKKKNQNT